MVSKLLNIGTLLCLLTMAPWATAQDFVEEGDPASPEGITYSYEGVDILLVVDNSASMREEQEVLAEQVYTLVGALAHPVDGWPYPAVEDVRVGVVSSDMGLQVDGETGIPNPSYNCGPYGDDGRLETSATGSILDLTGASIMCDSSAVQCPEGWTCEQDDEDTVGRCVPQDGTSTIACRGLTPIVEPGDDMETQVACAVQLGTDGCGIEQQLAAGLAGVKNADGFDDPDRLLVVLVISDEEDCSIASADIFEDEMWKDQELINMVCNHPETPDYYLLSLEEIRRRLVDMKGDEEAVVFAGIVGVPPKTTCEGLGSGLADCLDEPEMDMIPTVFDDRSGQYKHFQSACRRLEGDLAVTEARPGRRYVELATLFGDRGYIFSICKDEWTLPMQRVAKTVLRSMIVEQEKSGTIAAADEAAVKDDASGESACSVTSGLGAGSHTGLLTSLVSLLQP